MKKRDKILCGVLVLSLIIGTAVPSRATIKDEKDKLNNLQNQQEDVQQQINDLEKSKADAKTFINTVDSQVSAISKQMYDNENELDKTENKIKKNEKKLENAQTSIENQYAAMKLRIQFMYENGNTQMLDLILSSKSVGDFLNKAEYISEISSYDRKMLNKMKETKQEIADTQVALEDSKTNLENLQTKLSKQKSDLQILSDAKEKEMEEYNNLISAGKKNKDNIDDEISNQKQVIQEMESIEKAREEAARKAALAAQNANKSTGQSSASTGVTKTNPNTDSNAGSTQNTVNSATGYIWPLPGYSTVSSDFGYRSDPFSGKQSYHSGIDIPAPAGTRIVAAASGQVAWANYSTTAGNWIGIDHGNGVYTVYMHCSALIVSAGQNVSAGDVIGLVGTTGSSTGNHLHFSVRLNGAYVSPWNYVSK